MPATGDLAAGLAVDRQGPRPAQRRAHGGLPAKCGAGRRHLGRRPRWRHGRWGHPPRRRWDPQSLAGRRSGRGRWGPLHGGHRAGGAAAPAVLAVRR